MKVFTQDVLRVLQSAPAGMTTRQLAERFHARPDTVSGRLAKMHCYGQVGREWRKEYTPTGRHYRTSLWSAA